jgi:hypothetical protein
MKFFPPEIKSYQISAHGGLRSPIGAAKVGGGGLIKVGQRRRMNIIMREVRVTSIINHGRGGASSIHPSIQREFWCWRPGLLLWAGWQAPSVSYRSLTVNIC